MEGIIHWNTPRAASVVFDETDLWRNWLSKRMYLLQNIFLLLLSVNPDWF